MGDLIRELGRQATLWCVDQPNQDDFDAMWEEKFAELIVRECVGQIQPMWNRVQEIGTPPGYDYDTFDLAYNDCMNAIKEHFGVKE